VDGPRTARANFGFWNLAIFIEKLDVIVFVTKPDFAGARLEIGLLLLSEFFELICGRADLDTDVRRRRYGLLEVAMIAIWIKPKHIGSRCVQEYQPSLDPEGFAASAGARMLLESDQGLNWS
jgi:hypothetical protein